MNITRNNGDTALSLAAMVGELDCIKVLLKSRAHINCKPPRDVQYTVMYHLGNDKSQGVKLYWLLKAAGERIGRIMEVDKELYGNLRNLCREKNPKSSHRP